MKIIIKGEPRTKKNSMQIVRFGNRMALIPSKPYNVYKKLFISQIDPLNEQINYGVNVKCVYYMKTKRKVDLSNLLSATNDLLVDSGVLEDDNSNIIVGHDGSRVCYDKENPRVEIFVDKI